MSTPRSKVTDPEYQSICNAISSSVRRSFADPTQNEPQMVANLVYHIPYAINRIRLTSKQQLSSNGIFIHQTPKVKCSGFPKRTPASVELGDLLLLVTDSDGKRRALILQAKKTPVIPAETDNKNQHHLYAKQPHFTYVHSGPHLNDQTRRITGLDVYNGCKYVLILEQDNRAVDYRWDKRDSQDGINSQPPVAWVAQPSWPELTHYRSFEQELVDFILGFAGKPYEPGPHGNNKNWDRVIQDLKNVVPNKQSALVSNASGGTVTTRGYPYCFLSGQPFESSILTRAFSVPTLRCFPQPIDDGPPKIPPRPEEPSEESLSGMSILEFKFTETEQE